MTQEAKEDDRSYQKRFDEYRRNLNKCPSIFGGVEKLEESEDLTDSSRLYLLVFAPAIIGFVNWVLKDAEERGIERLYFLSRDAYMFYITALKMARENGLKVECRYLNVSRYSMRSPEYHMDLENAIDRICVNGIDVTIDVILKRADLTSEEADQVIKQLGLEGVRKKVLNNKEIQKLNPQLKNSEYFKSCIYAHSVSKYRNAIGYLEQEGLLINNNQAVVDSGWVGTLQQSIENLLKSKNEKAEIGGYYFGMYDIPKGADENKYKTFYFGSKDNLKRKVHFANSLFESIITSGEGMTTGYGYKENYYPVKNDVSVNHCKIVSENTEKLTKLLEEISLKNLDDILLSEIIEAQFESFMAEPTMLEVGCYGDSLFSDDIKEDRLKKVAAELSYEEIKNQRFFNKALIIAGLKKAEIHESAWLEGSIVRNGKNVRSSLRHARFYKKVIYFRKQLR